MKNEDAPAGVALAMTAYVIWGALPLYMKALAHVPPVEVVAHRVLWSVPVAALALVALRRTADLRAALGAPRMLAMAAGTATLISVNWSIYVWSVAQGRALDAALAYYINPLFSVLLGAALLGERMSRMQTAAVALAAGAVVILTVDAGGPPLPALGMTLSWGAYAYLKKSLPVGPNQGFLLEVLLLSPLALGHVAWLGATGSGHFLAGAGRDTWLLAGCGLITAVPLIAYANGAKLLRLSTIGMLQYTAPTLIFLVAVFVFDEPFGRARAVAFPMIWAALALYTASMLRQARARRIEAARIDATPR